MSEQETNNPPLERRPACDNCKTRKTKCDRRSPCSSCVTLEVACRTTHTSSEKRQRVLLSSKYEEAVQDVNRQLIEVREMLQKLVLSKDRHVQLSPGSTGRSSGQAHQTPRSMIDEQLPSLASVSDGFTGDSSFQSHAYKVKSALEETLAASHLINVEAPAILSSQRIRELLQGADSLSSSTSPRSEMAAAKPVLQPLESDFGNMPLPPLDVVLKVLRLAKMEKQRFFVDVPIFNEEEFTEMCRDLYFATEPISIWPWIEVNVGLYFLFLGVTEPNCARMGTTIDELRSHCVQLRTNLESAMQSLRLCSDPTVESCRALAVMGSFYVKEGYTTTGWRLVSGAARAALDLGMHRVPGSAYTPELSKMRHVFWHIYCWDKGLAITCGKTPVIPLYDVTTVSPVTLEGTGRAADKTYGAFIEYAIITGEIQQVLFSASAQHSTQDIRFGHAKNFAARLRNNQESVRTARYEDEHTAQTLGIVVASLEIMMYSLLAMVYRVLPPDFVQSHPLQCSDESVESARMALSILVKFGRAALDANPRGWTMLLNVILSLVPFVSFIVLAGNAIATSSSDDLELLSAVLSVLAPCVNDSPTARNIHDACERFKRIAELAVSSEGEHSYSRDYQTAQTSNLVVPLDGSAAGLNNVQTIPMDYGFPMAQQDWDNVMMGFEEELGHYDSRTLTSILEPYMMNADWQFDGSAG